MKEMLKRIKADMILSAILCMIMGVVLFIWPDATIDIFCKVLSVGLIIMGTVYLVSFFINHRMNPFSGALGLIVLLVGFWIFLKPESIASLVPIVIGVILVVHGVQDIKFAIESKQNGYEKWWTMLIVALVSLIFGVLCIIHAFGVAKLALQFIGAALVYDGISDMWVIIKTVKVAKAMKAEADALDVEFKEMDE